jgi:hypothetical protein
MFSINYQVEIPNSNYIKKWTNDHTYQGYINKDTKLYEGEGRIKFLNSNSNIIEYYGEFLEGKALGNGTIIYKDGSIYKGQTKDLKKSGYGTLYETNGKILYTGLWIDDISDRPIYTVEYSIFGNLLSQCYKINDMIQGWYFSHFNNNITGIRFYKDNKIIKETYLDNSHHYLSEKYLKICHNKNQSNNNIHKFLFTELPKLEKNNYLHEFLTNPNNLKMLNDIVSDNTPVSYKFFNSNGIYEQNEIIESYDYEFTSCSELLFKKKLNNYKVTAKFLKDKIIVGIFNTDSKFDNYKNATLYSCPNAQKIDNVNIVKSSTSDFYELESSTKLKMIGQCDKIYAGDFNIDSFYGKGWIKLINKTYSGIFNYGLKEGIEKKDNVKIYQGKFNDHIQYNGLGTLFLKSGSIKYEGYFLEGKFDGYGTSFYDDTTIIEYVGQWRKNKKCGKGVLYSISGDEIYSGMFQNDQIL